MDRSRNRLWNVETLDNGYREELRDKFATAALTALLSHVPSVAFAARSDEQAEDEAHEKLACEAYRWADAMLKARAGAVQKTPRSGEPDV